MMNHYSPAIETQAWAHSKQQKQLKQVKYPFKSVDEFKDYVIKKMNLNLLLMLAGMPK